MKFTTLFDDFLGLKMVTLYNDKKNKNKLIFSEQEKFLFQKGGLKVWNYATSINQTHYTRRITFKVCIYGQTEKQASRFIEITEICNAQKVQFTF